MINLPDKEKLVRNFNCCSDWEDKYLYLIELGEKILDCSKKLYQVENLIAGCQSRVWIRMIPQEDESFIFEGDSDAVIVKGLIAVIFSFYNGLKKQEIIDLDIYYWFQKISLTQYLTPLRSQGLEAIIRTIRRNAKYLI